jgi:hypothetical protein
VIERKVYFIGMNKIATTSLSELFKEGGYKSWHYSCMNTVTHESVILGEEMAMNVENGKYVMHGIDHAQVYSDMFFHRDYAWVDGVKWFDKFYNRHPESYFILQTRDMDEWLDSKRRHKNGDYIKRSCEYWQLEPEEMIEWFRNDRIEHEERVRSFFENKKYANFLEWNLNTDPISKVIDFVKRDYTLDEKNWGNHGVKYK